MTTDSVAEPAASSRFRGLDNPLVKARDFVLFLAVIAYFIVLSITADQFLTTTNILNLLDVWAPVVVMAIGMTIVVIAGGFDLSIVAIYQLTSIIAVKAANGWGGEIGLIVALAVGTGLGCVNGILTTWGGLNPFVATIGTSIAYIGLATIVSEGFILSVTVDGFGWLGQDTFLDAAFSVYLMLIVIGLAGILLRRTSFGRYVFAVGGNPEAARLAGVPVQRVIGLTYALAGLSAGLAAAIVTSRSLTASAVLDAGTQSAVWTAVLLGGSWGGIGAIWRTLVGVALLALIANGFNLLGVDPLYQQVVTAVILLSAVMFDVKIRARTGG